MIDVTVVESFNFAFWLFVLFGITSFLAFAGTLFYGLRHKTPDGKMDKTPKGLILPFSAMFLFCLVCVTFGNTTQYSYSSNDVESEISEKYDAEFLYSNFDYRNLAFGTRDDLVIGLKFGGSQTECVVREGKLDKEKLKQRIGIACDFKENLIDFEK